MGSNELEDLLKSDESTENEIWLALSESEIVPLWLGKYLLSHHQLSDRIVRSYFNGDFPVDEDFDRRGAAVFESVFWEDLESALKLPGLTLETRTLLVKLTAATMNDYCEEWETQKSEAEEDGWLEDWSIPNLDYFEPKIPHEFFKIATTDKLSEQFGQFSLECENLAIATEQLADFIRDSEPEYHMDRIQVLEEGLDLLASFRKR